MSVLNQLRITDPEDRLKIYDLDEAGSITSLGQDEANDILLEGPGVAAVQLELDYRQEPYRLTVPEEAEPVTVNGQPVSPGSSCEIHDRDEIRVAGYTIVFRVREEEPGIPDDVPEPLPQPEPEPSPPDDVPQPTPSPEPGPLPPQDDVPEPIPSPEPTPLPPQDDVPAPAPLPQPGPPPPKEPDFPDTEPAEPAIRTSVSPEERAIHVEQTATFQLSVVNAGELVADFHVAVEGVPQEWVTISPDEFHLNEGEEGITEVRVTPPRLPASRAGTHQLALVVTSPTYRGKPVDAKATVTIHPYYDLTVGNLSPRHLSIPGFQPAGETGVPLTNRGNSEVVAILTGEDDARACHFEFEIPDKYERSLYVTKEADLWVPADQAVSVPVKLVPWNRPLIGAGGRLVDLRPRVHPYTISVSMAQGGQRPLTLSGEWENVPRFSRRVLLISALALILLLLLSFCPGITDYHLAATPQSIRAGQIVELTWTPRPLISFKLDGQSADSPVTLRPEQTTTYQLRAETWLSRLLPFLEGKPDEVTIGVRPVKPDILLFEASPERVIPGETVILSWVVDDADEMVLIDHTAELQETLTSPCGSREIQVGQDSVRYTLRATAANGSVTEGTVAVEVGSPVIRVFSVKPTEITSTATVEVAWWVLQAPDGITLSYGLPEQFSRELAVPRTSGPPISMQLEASRDTMTLTISDTTVYSLSARSGDTKVTETARVKVPKPTPAPSPTPPHGPTKTPALDEAPGMITVYTALSEKELQALGATKTISLTEILDELEKSKLTLSETELREIAETNREALTEVLRSLGGTQLTREDLKEFDYAHVVRPTGAPAINVLIVRRSTQDLIRLLLVEKENPRADVIWGVAATGMIRLRAEGLLEPMAGLNQPQGMGNIKSNWLDPTSPPQWLGLSAWPAAFCVNKDELVPDSWADLTNSDYDDRIAMPNPYSSGTGYMVVSGLLQMYAFGEPAGWEYLDLLHENVARYTHTGEEPCDLAAGDSEIAIGIGVASVLTPEASAKLIIVYPEEGYGWEMDAVALARKDLINNDALAFVAWAISKEAMEEYARFRPIVSYEGLEPCKPESCFVGFERDKMIPNRLLWASANYERITEEWLSRYAGEPDLIQLEPAQ